MPPHGRGSASADQPGGGSVGTAPARFVEVARLEAAPSLLEAGALGIQQIAHRRGFGSTDTMRRASARHLEIAPGDYRRRFQAHA